jgi:hypothetical protein
VELVVFLLHLFSFWQQGLMLQGSGFSCFVGKNATVAKMMALVAASCTIGLRSIIHLVFNYKTKLNQKCYKTA